MVERGDLDDHPADADARQVRRPIVEFPGQRRGVDCKIAQRVRRSLGIDGGRRAGIALSWPDALCAALARGGRHVVRYDLLTLAGTRPVAPLYGYAGLT